MVGEYIGRKQVEGELLAAAPNRLGNLLRVGRGQHKDHVRWRLLQRLQQRRFGRFRQHVDLVKDVHLVPAGGAEHGFLDESRMESTPLLLAASSSCTSNDVPASTALQLSHSQHGSPSCTFVQFSTLAKFVLRSSFPFPEAR